VNRPNNYHKMKAAAKNGPPKPMPGRAVVTAPPPAKEKVPRTEGRDLRVLRRGRLPGGSEFHAVQNPAGTEWIVTLTIPVPGGKALQFSVLGTGYFKTCEKCDDAYRQYLKDKAVVQDVTAPPPASAASAEPRSAPGTSAAAGS